MPIYEYRCKACGRQYEKIVFQRNAPAPACPECGSSQSEKLISVPGAVGVPSTGAAAKPASCPAAASGQCGSGFS